MCSITPAHIHRITPLRWDAIFLKITSCLFMFPFSCVLFSLVHVCASVSSDWIRIRSRQYEPEKPENESKTECLNWFSLTASKACEPWPPRAWPTKQVLDGQDMFCYLAPLSITLDITLSHRDWEYVYELDKSPQGFPVQHVTNQKHRLICQQPSS